MANTECAHEHIEFDEGNYVPQMGWELHPGFFCVDCGKEVEDEDRQEVHDGRPKDGD